MHLHLSYIYSKAKVLDLFAPTSQTTWGTSIVGTSLALHQNLLGVLNRSIGGLASGDRGDTTGGSSGITACRGERSGEGGALADVFTAKMLMVCFTKKYGEVTGFKHI